MRKSGLLRMERLERAAQCLRVLAHPARLRMVDILMRGESCVGEIARLCDLPHHQACGHLRLMQGQGLLASRRKGRSVVYRIVSPNLPGVLRCIKRNCRDA